LTKCHNRIATKISLKLNITHIAKETGISLTKMLSKFYSYKKWIENDRLSVYPNGEFSPKDLIVLEKYIKKYPELKLLQKS